MKKVFLLIAFLSVSLFAQSKAPKMGCVLSQKGEVTLSWAEYGSEKYAVQGKSKEVKYIAIKKEGHIFKEILVGSIIEADFKDKKILAKITHIQSKKRIGRGPRHGVIEMNIKLNNISKNIPLVYFYEGGDMLMKSNINLKDFNLSNETTYTELSFGLHVYSVVCAIE